MFKFFSKETKTHLSLPTEAKPNWLLYWFALEAKETVLNLHPYKWNGRSGIFMGFFYNTNVIKQKMFGKTMIMWKNKWPFLVTY